MDVDDVAANSFRAGERVMCTWGEDFKADYPDSATAVEGTVVAAGGGADSGDDEEESESGLRVDFEGRLDGGVWTFHAGKDADGHNFYDSDGYTVAISKRTPRREHEAATRIQSLQRGRAARGQRQSTESAIVSLKLSIAATEVETKERLAAAKAVSLDEEAEPKMPEVTDEIDSKIVEDDDAVASTNVEKKKQVEEEEEEKVAEEEIVEPKAIDNEKETDDNEDEKVTEEEEEERVEPRTVDREEKTDEADDDVEEEKEEDYSDDAMSSSSSDDADDDTVGNVVESEEKKRAEDDRVVAAPAAAVEDPPQRQTFVSDNNDTISAPVTVGATVRCVWSAAFREDYPNERHTYEGRVVTLRDSVSKTRTELADVDFGAPINGDSVWTFERSKKTDVWTDPDGYEIVVAVLRRPESDDKESDVEEEEEASSSDDDDDDEADDAAAFSDVEKDTSASPAPSSERTLTFATSADDELLERLCDFTDERESWRVRKSALEKLQEMLTRGSATAAVVVILNAKSVRVLQTLADRARETNAINQVLALESLATLCSALRFRILKKAQGALELCVAACLDALADHKRNVHDAALGVLNALAERSQDIYGMLKRRKHQKHAASQRVGGVELVLPGVSAALARKPAGRGALVRWLREKLTEARILTPALEAQGSFTDVPVVFCESVVRLVRALVPCLIDRTPGVRHDAEAVLAIALKADREGAMKRAEAVLTKLKDAQSRAARERIQAALAACGVVDSPPRPEKRSSSTTRMRRKRKTTRDPAPSETATTTTTAADLKELAHVVKVKSREVSFSQEDMRRRRDALRDALVHDRASDVAKERQGLDEIEAAFPALQKRLRVAMKRLRRGMSACAADVKRSWEYDVARKAFASGKRALREEREVTAERDSRAAPSPNVMRTPRGYHARGATSIPRSSKAKRVMSFGTAGAS